MEIEKEGVQHWLCFRLFYSKNRSMCFRYIDHQGEPRPYCLHCLNCRHPNRQILPSNLSDMAPFYIYSIDLQRDV